MKRKIRKSISVLLAIVILSLSFTTFAGAQSQTRLEPVILSSIERKVLTIPEKPVSYIPLWECDDNAENLLSSVTKDYLSTQTSLQVVAPISVFQDVSFNRIVKRIDTATAQIEVDQNNNLVQYINLEDLDGEGRYKIKSETEKIAENSVNSSKDLQSTIAQLQNALDLQEYSLVKCSEDIPNEWLLIWHKVVGENLLNPFDVVVVTVDGTDGSVSLITRNSEEPNSVEPLVTSSQALVFAKNILDSFKYDSIKTELSYVRPNFYWEKHGDISYEEADFIRLAWIVTVDNSIAVYVDARTGEILGGAATAATYGRSVAPNPVGFVYHQNLAIMGQYILENLGYTHHLNRVDYTINQADIEYVLLHSNLKGLVLSCHGNPTVLSDGRDNSQSHWAISSSQIKSGWKFVFLNACESAAANSEFPSRFINVSGTNQCFVGWNIAVNVYTLYYFTFHMWDLIDGKTAIHGNVLKARSAVIAQGYADCNPGFWGDMNYTGKV